MELRRLCVCMAFVVLAVILQSSEAKYARHRREADIYYDEAQADASADEQNDEAAGEQNDGEGGAEDGENDSHSELKIATEPTKYEMALGRSVRLECKVEPNVTYVVLAWYKDTTLLYMGNIKLDKNERHEFDAGSWKNGRYLNLVIKDLTVEDSGVYRCEIQQAKKAYIEHTLVAFEVPKVKGFFASSNGHVTEGSDMRLTCDVSGSPPPKIVWSKERQKGNVNLNENDGQFENNSVYIQNTTREQAGKYYCYVFNDYGHDQSELEVIVLGKPRVHVHKTVVNSAINVEAILQCTVHDDIRNGVQIRWYKDGRPIDNSIGYSVSTSGLHSNLTVTPQSNEDFGTFTCEGKNSLSTHNKSIELVQSPVVEHFEANGTELSWVIHSHLPVEEVELNIKNADGGDWKNISVPLETTTGHKHKYTYTIKEDQIQAGKYEVVVKAKNSYSWSGSPNSVFIDIEAQPAMSIQHASVFRTGNSADSIRPTALFASIFMYLLVRTL